MVTGRWSLCYSAVIYIIMGSVFISTFCLHSAYCYSKLSKCHSSPISLKISTVNKAQEEIPRLEVWQRKSGAEVSVIAGNVLSWCPQEYCHTA